MSPFALAALLVIGCESMPTSTPAVASPVASTQASAPAMLSPSEFGEALRFRKDFGLRSDEAWIREVAADPNANRTAFGVPLTSQEVDDLNKRNRSTEQVRNWVIGYGEQHPDEWGGAFIDQASGGVLVAQFTGNLELHRLALFAQIWPKANVEIRQVRWAQAALQTLVERIQRDEAWLAGLPAGVRSLGVDIVGNRVDLAISSPIPAAPQLVLEHFGVDATLLTVTSDGNGALLLPPGKLVVTVTDESGAPVPGLACVAYPDAPGASNPRPDPIPRTDGSGTCALDVRTTGYWIVIEDPARPEQALGFGRAVVGSRDPAAITIVVRSAQ